MTSNNIIDFNCEITDFQLALIASKCSKSQLIQLTNSLTNQENSVARRNEEKTKKFAEKIINKKNERTEIFEKFLQSKSLNGLLYAPTQVGKSAATLAFIETCFQNEVPVIVSTDNKTDQQEQLFDRIEIGLGGDNVELLKVSDKDFSKRFRDCVASNNRRFVIFCLDNCSQIEKIISELSKNYFRYNGMQDFSRLAIIHDEADTVTKNKDVFAINSAQAESHKKWLELRDLIDKKIGTIDLKRLFVSATPENCVMLYSIDCPDVIQLETPSFYTGYNDIQHSAIHAKTDLKAVLRDEVKRIKEQGTSEAILHCVERLVVKGQEKTLKSLIDLDCIVNTYNGSGIYTYMRTQELASKFEEELADSNTKFVEKDNYYNIKSVSIRKFYDILEKIGEKCVITIGKDLISRGISYVSTSKENPITATTMFFKPGTTASAVNICQTIGRITGCAMPTLRRKLYSTDEVFDTYVKFNKNQELFIEKIQKAEPKVLTKDIIESMIFDKYKRNIDRPKLSLKMNMIELKHPVDAPGTIDGVKLDKLETWISGTTLVGRMIKALYAQENAITIHQLSSLLNYTGTEKSMNDNVSNGGSINSKYGKLWIVSKNIVILSSKIRKYITTNKLLL